MATFIPTGKWKRKGANLPRNVQIAKAKKGKVKVGKNPLTGTWTKRDDKSGKFMDVKASAKPFKGVRTTHRSSTGSKLYAVRDSEGQFKDIQTYKKAHGQDVKRKSKKEQLERIARRFSGTMKRLAKT